MPDTIFQLLARAARADLECALRWYEETGDAEWQQLAINARQQLENYEVMA